MLMLNSKDPLPCKEQHAERHAKDTMLNNPYFMLSGKSLFLRCHVMLETPFPQIPQKVTPASALLKRIQPFPHTNRRTIQPPHSLCDLYPQLQ